MNARQGIAHDRKKAVKDSNPNSSATPTWPQCIHGAPQNPERNPLHSSMPVPTPSHILTNRQNDQWDPDCCLARLLSPMRHSDSLYGDQRGPIVVWRICLLGVTRTSYTGTWWQKERDRRHKASRTEGRLAWAGVARPWEPDRRH